MKPFKKYLYEELLATLLSADVRDAIKRKGGKIYQIGGAVRDEILGKVSKDLDILVVGIEVSVLAQVLKPFGKVNLVGKSFGVIKFTPEGTGEEVDISVPRIDSKSTGKGHKDFEIKLGKGITLKQDQMRRDFWMNTIAQDIETGEVHDIGREGKLDIDEDEGIPSTTNWQKFLSKITRQPYRGAAQGASGYTPVQLNSMNALGGYYSEPAREQRRERSRVANMLARQAAGKSYSQANLNRLTMGSRPGHYDPPGGGGAAADTSPSTPGNNPFGYDLGGLATMFERRR